MNPTLVSLKSVSIKRQSATLLEQLDWTINKGEHWALIGPSGSGKTTLLHAIRTMAFVTHGEVYYPGLESLVAEQQQSDPYFSSKDLIALVSAKYNFTDLTGTSSNMYYQQRYNSLDSESVETVNDHLQKLKPQEGRGQWTFDRVVERFNLSSLKDKSLIKLSNGEAKRLLLASELIKNPVLLLMDNPLAGLDPEAREEMNGIIQEISDSGITTVLVTSRQEIPDLVTHVAVIKAGTLQNRTKKDFNSQQKDEFSQPIDDEELKKLLVKKHQPFQLMIKMNKVSVTYGDNNILSEVDWEIRQQERWLVKGHNGAGKSTLLSLITADNPQSYSKDIILFDKKRGTGESIWDIKKKIGLVSAELFQYFPSHSTCVKVVESGFYDTMGLFRASKAEKAEKAMQWLNVLGITDKANTLFRNLPESMQRLTLLARALVKDPPLLILDEPGQGLDLDQQHFFKELIDAICSHSDITIIYVSHFQEEIPDCFTHQLELKDGKVIQYALV